MKNTKFPVKNFWGRNGKAVSVKSQQEKIVAYLKEYGSISNSEAVYKLGINQLSVRIRELESQGVEIVGSYQNSILKYGLGGANDKRKNNA